MAKTKTLIIDDSAVIRSVLTEILSADPEIEVVGTAADPYIAREKIKQLQPDVVTLDVEMPRMDGITFLKQLMRLRPMPVVMLSTLTQAQGLVTLDALEIGAVDYIAKPNTQGESLQAKAQEICEKVKVAARASVSAFNPSRFKQKSIIYALDKKVQKSNKIVAIGASTGGTEAIREVLKQLPGQMVPVVITQHIPGAFSSSFAQRLDRNCQMNVVHAADGMKLAPGFAYVAPGDRHLGFSKAGSGLVCSLADSELVNRHKPSVEVMFDSLRANYSGEIIAVMLTGMGADGAEAMLRIKQAGHPCLVQDEKTSVVWGMPKVAYQLGVTSKPIPLPQIPEAIVAALSNKNLQDI